MKTAIVHEWFTGVGGSEKVVKELYSIFPGSDVFVLVHDEKNMPEEYNKMNINTSFIQKIPFAKKHYRNLLVLMPYAVEQYDLSAYDLVISSNTCCSKGIITKTDTLHICYCNTPMRYGWDLYHEYIKEKNILVKFLIALQMKNIRIWDRLSADRVDFFIANSENVAERIKKIYRRESKVIYPPVDTDFYALSEKKREEYYLIVSRLVSYKRVDIAVKAFNKLGRKLVIIGEGPEYRKLRKIAGDNIVFTGRLNDNDVREHYRKCKAFIFPGEEDFGITPVEAQACGAPVIAYGKGGVLETVIDNKTGLFFYEQNEISLEEKIKEFENMQNVFKNKTARENAEKFSREIFRERIKKYINEKIE